MKILRTTYESLTDEQLMEKLSNGDRRAFDCLYGRYAQPMKNYFYRLMWKDAEKAEDFVHDLFAKIIQNPDSFDASRSFKTWFYSVANNMVKNEYKKQEVRKGTQLGVDQYENVSDHAMSVLQQVEEKQFQEVFQQELETLEEKHHIVFSLRHFEGLSIKEIAEIVESNEGTVKSRLFYATKYLAEKLKAFNPVLNR